MTVHIIVAIFLILFVLVQSGKGAEVSASFGGSSQTVFGSSGGANFFVKATWFLVTVFVCTSITLTVMSTPKSAVEAHLESQIPTPMSESAPAKTDAKTGNSESVDDDAADTDPVDSE